jgi:hypothetical protein
MHLDPQVVACPDLTGFGEIVPGDTMLHTTTEAMIAVLGDEKPAYLKILHSIIGVIVATAIFDMYVL